MNDLPEGIIVWSFLGFSASAGRTYPSRAARLSAKSGDISRGCTRLGDDMISRSVWTSTMIVDEASCGSSEDIGGTEDGDYWCLSAS